MAASVVRLYNSQGFIRLLLFQYQLCLYLFITRLWRYYYATLNKKHVIDNQEFWKTVKPMLSNKLVSRAKITLVENEKVIADDKLIAGA